MKKYILILATIAALSSPVFAEAPATSHIFTVADDDKETYPIQKLTQDVWMIGYPEMSTHEAVRFAKIIPSLFTKLDVALAAESRVVVSITSLTAGASIGTSGFIVVTAIKK